jgi:hypothetical protein
MVYCRMEQCARAWRDTYESFDWHLRLNGARKGLVPSGNSQRRCSPPAGERRLDFLECHAEGQHVGVSLLALHLGPHLALRGHNVAA